MCVHMGECMRVYMSACVCTVLKKSTCTAAACRMSSHLSCIADLSATSAINAPEQTHGNEPAERGKMSGFYRFPSNGSCATPAAAATAPPAGPASLNAPPSRRRRRPPPPPPLILVPPPRPLALSTPPPPPPRRRPRGSTPNAPASPILAPPAPRLRIRCPRPPWPPRVADVTPGSVTATRHRRGRAPCPAHHLPQLFFACRQDQEADTLRR